LIKHTGVKAFLIILFSLGVNTPLLAALLLEISFVEIPRSFLLRGVSLLIKFFIKIVLKKKLKHTFYLIESNFQNY